jgi:TRAP-type C4-dicarboxylate transport system permease small subunit
MSDIDNLGSREPEYRLAASVSHAADQVLGAVAAAILFAMMAVTSVDVTGRYLFNSPLQGGYEFTQLLMLSLVFAGLPTVTRRGDHITVGLFNNAFQGIVRKLRDSIIALVVAVASAYLAWRLYLLGGRFALFGDVTATVRIPLAPIAYAGAGAMVLAAVAALLRLADAWAGAREAVHQ